MDEGAVGDERDAHGNVQEAESIEEKDAGASGGRREAIKGEQEEEEPEDGVDGLDGEFCGGEEQGKERDVSGDGERAKGTKVAAVLEREQGKWNEDEEDGFLVHVPAKEKGGIGAEGNGTDKSFPGRCEEELCERE